MIRRESIWKSVDWFTVTLYVVLIVAGWFSVYSASYNFDDSAIFDFSTWAGKQLVWMGCSLVVASVIMLIDDDFYDLFAYMFYALLMLLLIVTIFIAPDTKGSRSWLIFGPVSLQPAEFAKFATALAIAKFMGSYGFTIKNIKNVAIIAMLILTPIILIIMQKETGSALVYSAFLLMLYREGMPGMVLFMGISAVIFFIVGIKFDDVLLSENLPTSVGRFSVLLLILLFSGFMIGFYTKKWKLGRNISVVSVVVTLATYYFSEHIMAFDIIYVELVLCGCVALYLLYSAFRWRRISNVLVALYLVGSVGFLYSSNYVFDNVLEPHQQMRIKVVLGMEEDLAGAGYNVNQSKIAIGSGGLYGKGFLNGTQTKLKYVPEQHTDFIFCTIGEEQGFVGSVAVLFLYLIMILRLVFVAERQSTSFGRIYGYSVMSIFLFHLFINVGMVLGVAPVIGIPLPFFSYGGSSLWGFTILLFIFLRIDAGRGRKS